MSIGLVCMRRTDICGRIGYGMHQSIAKHEKSDLNVLRLILARQCQLLEGYIGGLISLRLQKLETLSAFWWDTAIPWDW